MDNNTELLKAVADLTTTIKSLDDRIQQLSNTNEKLQEQVSYLIGSVNNNTSALKNRH